MLTEGSETSDVLQFRIEPLDASRHRREAFDCGVESLTTFLRERACKEVASKTCACFVAVPAAEPGCVAGYYTFSAATIALEQVPPELARRLPRYPLLPATLLGRLACDLRFKGVGLGRLLVVDALARAFLASGEVGSVVVVTDPKEATVSFYEKFGFRRLRADRMLLMMATIRHLLTGAAKGD
jgi:GNAT superfamily N-acetyltransferase